jgi:hypothetical protein
MVLVSMRVAILTAATLVAASPSLGRGGGDALLAVVFAHGGEVARLDPATMRPLGLPAKVGFAPSTGVAVTSDGATVAIGSDEGPARVAIVDVRTMTLRRTIRVAEAGAVVAVAWPVSRRVLALTAYPSAAIAVVDPVSGRVLAVRELPGVVAAITATRRALVVLVAPRHGIGSARLLVVDGRTTRSVRLNVSAGFQTAGVLRQRTPALAPAPDGRRVAVVPPDGRVVEVDVATGRVRYHAVAARRFAAAAKSIPGAWRRAVWSGRTLAVTGADTVADRRGRTTTLRVGLELVDTRTWLAKSLDPLTTSVALVERGFVAWRARGSGVTLVVYQRDGRQRFRRIVHSARTVATAGRYIYLGDSGGTRFTVVDGTSGRITARRATPSTTVVVGSG